MAYAPYAFMAANSVPKASSSIPNHLSASYMLSDPAAYNASLTDVLVLYRRPGTNRVNLLNKIIAQTRKELKSTDFNLKLQAACKLVFLFNEGIDIQWAAFNVIELMSSSELQHKRIAYSLAPLVFLDLHSSAKNNDDKQSYHEELTQLLTLTPNIFRKDF